MERFDKARYKSVQNYTPVYQYALDGTFIAAYESALDARRKLNIKSDIGSAIRRGGFCGGYQWSYEKLPALADRSCNTYAGKARKVGVYTKDNVLVETFDTVTACMKKYSACKAVLQGKRKYGNNHIFKYLN